MKLIDEIEKSLLGLNDVKQAVNILVEFIDNNDTIYYRDILSIKAIFSYIEDLNVKGILYDHEHRDIVSYIKSQVLNISKEIEKEQSNLFEESIRFIRKELKEIINKIESGKIEEVIQDYNRLFLKIHSRYYKGYLSHISREYDPTRENFEEYENLQRYELILLNNKILFEKELILNEVLKDKILSTTEVNNIIKNLSKGDFETPLLEIEGNAIKFLNEVSGKQFPYNSEIARKAILITAKYFDVRYKYYNGLMNVRNFIIKLKGIIDEFVEFIEICFEAKVEYIITGKFDFKTTNNIGQKIKSVIKELIAEAKLQEAIDLFLQNSNNDDLNNQLIIQRMRLMEDKKNMILGIERDELLHNKIAISLLGILDNL